LRRLYWTYRGNLGEEKIWQFLLVAENIVSNVQAALENFQSGRKFLQAVKSIRLDSCVSSRRHKIRHSGKEAERIGAKSICPAGL
jgi:hypothetical protein